MRLIGIIWAMARWRRATVVFVPGFMQRGDAWAPVAELLPERYPSVLLDHARAHLRGPPGGDRGGGGGAPCCAATRSAAGWRCTPRCATPARYAGLVHGRRLRGHRRARPRAARARRPTSSWPPGWRPRRSRRSWRVWERQPLFADQSDALVEAQRAGPAEPRPARARPAAAHRRPGRARAGLAPSCDGSTLPLLALAGARDERYAERAPSGWRARRRAGAAAVVEDAGHAAHSSGPEARWRESSLGSTFLDQHLGQRVVVRHVHAQARALRARPSARRAAAGQRAGDARRRTARAWPARRPAQRARTPPAAARRRCPRGRRACSTGRAQARCRARPAGASRAAPKPPLPAQLHVHRVAGAQLGGARARRRRARDRLVGRDRHVRPRRAPPPAPRASRRAAPRAGGRRPRARGSRSTASSGVHAPLASTRSAGHGPIASRTAATRSASSGRPDLELEARVAVAQALAAAARPPRPGGPAGSVRFTGIASAPGSPSGRPSPARLEVEPRHLLTRRAPAAARRAPAARRAARRPPRRARTPS